LICALLAVPSYSAPDSPGLSVTGDVVRNAGFVNVNGKGVSFQDHFSVYGSMFGSLGDDILLAIVAQSVADLYHPLTGIPLFGFRQEQKTPAPTPVGIVQKSPSTPLQQSHNITTMHFGGAVCPSYGVVSMDTPDRTWITSSDPAG
jgi:hypothetical protein